MAEIHDIRQRRLRDILRDDFKGVQRDLATKLDRDANYISRVLSSGAHRKKIGETFAREIEKRLNLPALSLDSAKESGVKSPQPPMYLEAKPTEEEMDLGREWGKLDEPLRTQLQTLIYTLVGISKRSRRVKVAGKQPPMHREGHS